MSSQKIGLYLVYLIGLALGASGIFKFIGAEEAAQAFGSSQAPYILGLVDLLIAAAIFIPRTRLLGVILAASYIGGIIAFSWLHEGETPAIGIAMNTLLYVGAALHWPKLQEGKV
ncbi:MAG: hypothetical protein AAFO91_04305 [Bacteroidota bacterium]